MKILTLYFKNINSLEGENLIDFQKRPLAKAGIFAIIGPNGSGKSTLLDAMCLAFYGETFRFDRPADHVMTHHTAESIAQIEFSLSNKKFRVRWQLTRENQTIQGRLLEPTMHLFSVQETQETLIADNSQTVPERIKTIIGMDFHNFTRSIMLAQGDFSAFLNALDNERMHILEKMSSQDIYEEHTSQLYLKTQQSTQALKQIKQGLTALPIMSAIEEETCVDNLIDFKAQIETIKQQQQQVITQLNTHQQVTTIQRQLADIEKKQVYSHRQIQQLETQLQQIKTVTKATIFEQEVLAIEQQEQQVSQGKKALHQHQRTLKKLQEKQKQLSQQPISPDSVKTIQTSEQKQVIDDLRYHIQQKNVDLKTERGSIERINNDILGQQQQQTEVLTWLQAHSGDKTLLTTYPQTKKLKRLGIDVEKMAGQCHQLEKQQQASQLALEKLESSVASTQSTLVNIKQALIAEEQKLAQMTEEGDINERQQLFVDQQQRTHYFRELHDIAKINHRVTKRGFLGFFNPQASKSPTFEALVLEIQEITREISEAQFLRNTLEKAIINENLLKRMSEHRKHLEKDHPCPLCGALAHPFRQRPPRESDSQHLLRDQKTKLQLLVLKANKLKKQLFDTEKSNAKEVDKNNHLQQHRSQWLLLSNKLNVAHHDMEIGNFPLMKAFLKKENSILIQYKQQLSSLQQQQVVVEKIKLQLSSEQKNYDDLKINLVTTKDKTQQLPQALTQQQTQHQQLKTDEKQLSEKTMAQLALLGVLMPVKNQDEKLTDALKIREQNYKIYLERDALIHKKLVGLNEKLTHHQDKMAQLNTQISQYTPQLATEEAIGLVLTQVKVQSTIHHYTQQSQAQRHVLHQQQEALKEKLHDTQFVNLRELKEALVLISEQDRVEQEYARLQQQVAYLVTEQQQLHTKLTIQQSLQQHDDLTDLATLKSQRRSLAEKINIAKAEIDSLVTKQQKQRSIQQQHTQLTEKLQQQQQDLQECEAGLQQSQENGMVFRRRVQLKMATKLLSQTNKILEKLNGRYYLRQAPSDTGLALEIEDTQQQNNRRLPQSLSGGESFVISLALALGLSELANNGQAVDFLFIDEGFGNLDSETLYTVISTLQTLQTQGKMVGIISHVDSIKKRIKTRIEMVKKPNGLSRLKKIS